MVFHSILTWPSNATQLMLHFYAFPSNPSRPCYSSSTSSSSYRFFVRLLRQIPYFLTEVFVGIYTYFFSSYFCLLAQLFWWKRNTRERFRFLLFAISLSFFLSCAHFSIWLCLLCITKHSESIAPADDDNIQIRHWHRQHFVDFNILYYVGSMFGEIFSQFNFINWASE